jgi:DNA-binding NarL/FixJ family response regulator
MKHALDRDSVALPWTILLVDDHPVLRESLSLRIRQEADMDVCAAVGSKDHAITAVREYHPDLVIVDLNLPDGHGLDLIRDIRAYDPKVRLLVFSMHDEHLYGERALRAGAQGYVMKSESPDVVMHAIRGVIGGRLAVSDSLAQKVLASKTGRTNEITSPMEQLSDRELQVFRLLANGVSTKQIAGRLRISIKTVETHRAGIKQKLGIGSATELVAAASRWLTENPSD